MAITTMGGGTIYASSLTDSKEITGQDTKEYDDGEYTGTLTQTPFKTGSEYNTGGDYSKYISSVIFLPASAPTPTGFTSKGGSVYQKIDTGFTITVYVITYTPPATIGNLNIQ